LICFGRQIDFIRLSSKENSSIRFKFDLLSNVKVSILALEKQDAATTSTDLGIQSDFILESAKQNSPIRVRRDVFLNVNPSTNVEDTKHDFAKMTTEEGTHRDLSEQWAKHDSANSISFEPSENKSVSILACAKHDFPRTGID
jgi:hypothetical protein